MGNVFNKTTKEYRTSVNTPDYPESDWVRNPAGAAALVAAGVPSSEWKEDPAGSVREMTAAEKDASILSSRKAAKVGALKNAVTVYIGGKYDQGQQTTVAGLWAEALSNNLTNRKALAQGIMDWVNSVLAEFYNRKNAVLAASTVAAVAAVSESFASFDATAPGTTVEELKNTVD